MVEIKPFKATILNPKLENRTELVCPVYDTIDARLYEQYSAREKQCNSLYHEERGRRGRRIRGLCKEVFRTFGGRWNPG